MPTISASINLRDNFSNIINNITSSVNLCISHMQNMQSTMGENVDTSMLDGARESINQVTMEINRMNKAVNKSSKVKAPDMSSTRKSYRDINTSAQNLNRHIRQNTESQNAFNRSVRSGSTSMSSLAGSIRSIAAAYLSLQGIKNTLDISDTLTQTTARVNAMREAFGETGITTKQLMNDIYKSAQDARGSYMDMAAVVARLGQNAKSAFSGSEEVIKFTNLLQKQMVLSGTSTEEAKNAMIQLSQALASGTLRGDELNSVMEQAPGITQRIADYLDVDVGKIKEMAAEGEITADIVKNAILSSEEEINSSFEAMPITWGQAWEKMKNFAINAFRPVLEKINSLANSDTFKAIADGAKRAFIVLSEVANAAVTALGNAADYIVSHWSTISPVVYGVVGALLVYAAASGICAIATALMNWQVTLTVLALAALITAVILVARKIAQTGETAATTFGVICGWINVVKAYFTNFGYEAANIAIALWNVFKGSCKNIQIAFKNSLNNVKAYFYDLGAVALRVIANICAQLSKLPFISFDFSGIEAAANNYANSYASKANALRGSNEKYVNVVKEFKKGLNTYDASFLFTKEDAMNAYKEGAAQGDRAVKDLKRKLHRLLDGDDNPGNLPFSLNGLNNGIGGPGVGGSSDAPHAADNLANIADNTGATAADTARIADAVEITDEDLKYLRDIAEREIIDRTVFTKVEVNMGGISNEVHNMTDLDAIPDYINSVLQEKIAISAEG